MGLRRCRYGGTRHRWTTIPPRILFAVARANGGKVRVPHAFVGAPVDPWCCDCGVRRAGGYHAGAPYAARSRLRLNQIDGDSSDRPSERRPDMVAFFTP